MGEEIYAIVQFNLGVSFDNNGCIEQAIEHWQNIQREDSEEMYAKAQLNLGAVYRGKKDTKLAIKFLLNIERKDGKEIFARAQFNLGLVYEDNNDTVLAIKYWSGIERDDDKEVYTNAQFQLGKLYIKKDEKNKAREHWNNVTYDKLDSWIKYIQSEYINLLKYNDDEKIINIIKYIFLIEMNVKIIVHELVLKSFNDIKNHKNKPECKVAHYTNVDVVDKLISNENTSFWLNMHNNMNDTTEGKTLFDFIGIDKKKEDEDLFAFLTSFTFNHNSLNQFRLYGKKDNIEGSGVSFVVNSNMFSDENAEDNVISYTYLYNKPILMNDIGIASETADNVPSPSEESKGKIIKQKLPLYRCIYINPDNGYVSVAKRNRYSFYLENENPEDEFTDYEKEIQIIEAKVKSSLIEIRNKYKDIIKNDIEDELKQSIDNLVEKITLLLRFLIKHASFEEEAECRILYIKPIDDSEVQHENERFFVPYKIPVVGKIDDEVYLEKMYLGPKVAPMVQMGLDYLYKKKIEGTKITKNIDIKISELPLA